MDLCSLKQQPVVLVDTSVEEDILRTFSAIFFGVITNSNFRSLNSLCLRELCGEKKIRSSLLRNYKFQRRSQLQRVPRNFKTFRKLDKCVILYFQSFHYVYIFFNGCHCYPCEKLALALSLHLGKLLQNRNIFLTKLFMNVNYI